MLNELIDWLISTVQQIDPVLRFLLAGLAILLETSLLIGLIVPGDTVLLVASTGVTNWGAWAALVAAGIIGALCGESLGYLIGRWLGEPVQRSWLGRKIGAKRWAAAEAFLHRRGGVAVFISRFLPVLHSLVPATAGIARMPYRKFMAWTAPACTIWALAYVSAGALATASYAQLGQRLHWAGYIFVAVIVLFLVGMWLVKRMLSRRVDAEVDAELDSERKKDVDASEFASE